jgi:hypothetical protein
MKYVTANQTSIFNDGQGNPWIIKGNKYPILKMDRNDYVIHSEISSWHTASRKYFYNNPPLNNNINIL